MIGKRKKKEPPAIAGIKVNLLLNQEENWAAIKQAIDDSFSAKALYHKLMKRAHPSDRKDLFWYLASFLASIVSFFYGILFFATAHRKRPLLKSARQQLEDYFMDPQTKIDINLAKSAARVKKLDEEITNIDEERYRLESELIVEGLGQVAQQEIHSMIEQLQKERKLREARIELMHKSINRLEKIKKAYQTSQMLDASRLKIEKLRWEDNDDSLQQAMKTNSEIEVLKKYVIAIEDAQDDALKESDYEQIIELERRIEEMKLED